MAKPQKDSGTVNFRPDPKINWALWFGTRVSGRSKQHIVTEGIARELDTIVVGGKKWHDFWHVEEGVRMVRFLFGVDRRLLDAHEEELLEFIETFAPFFFDNLGDGEESPERLRVLWPHVDELLEKWKKTNRTDPTAVGQAMAELLKARGRKVPREWLEYAKV
jgi:hypothetical protein